MAKLVAALGVKSLSKSQVSTLCNDLDEQVNAFRERPLTGKYPYLFLDAYTRRCASDGRSSRKPAWSRTAFAKMALANSSAWTSSTPKVSQAGRHSCVASAIAV